jgi:PAS domain S-box-containing protein
VEVAENVNRWTDHERIVFLLEAARQFGSTLDQDRIYAILLRLIDGVMPIEGLVVSSFDPETETIRAEHVWSDGAVHDISGFPAIKWNREGTGMQSRVILTGKAEVFDVGRKVREPNTNYIQVGPEGGTEPVEEEPATKTAMMAPMILEGHVTGVVQAMSDKASAYSPDDLNVFESLVLLLTPAWHNARTFQSASHQRKLTERIVETSPDIVYIFDLRTLKVEFSNRQLERQLGYSEEDIAHMQGDALQRAMHPEDAARLPELLGRYQRANDRDLLEAEWRLASKSGEWRWILNRARVFERDEEGRAVKIIGFATDITERKESEARRKESEKRYRFLAEHGTSIVWTADGEGKVDYVNGRWGEYFGAEPSDPAVADRVKLMHPEDREKVLKRWSRSVLSGAMFEAEMRLKRHDGEYRWHLCRATSMRDSEGRIVRWFGVFIDIDEQKEIEEELADRVAKRTTELQSAVTELEGFTYSVSHDLRGPLRAISASSMILRDDFGPMLPPEAHRHLLRQAEMAKRMGALIDDLLRLSRIGRQELAPAAFDLSLMAKDVAAELAVENRVEVQPGMDAYGDPRLIRFVLLNLLENAVKFSPNAGLIRIGKEDEAFFVADQGIGFDMAYASKLFKPFERLVREEEYPGTGIGLANVHRIIQRHGGQVSAESELGKGSTFRFTLPGEERARE